MLDNTALSELLTKHLRLSPNQGIRVRNVHRGSPADKAGIERDDIITGFEGEPVNDVEKLIEVVQKADVGTEVSLEVIHLGRKKTIRLTLEAFDGQFDGKYPSEPEIVQNWRPGKIFQLQPEGREWMEVSPDNMLGGKLNINRFFREIYTYQHSEDGKNYTITIEGNPDDEDTRIVVSIDGDEYGTKVKEIGKLPDEYLAAAEEALENAKKASRRSRAGTKDYTFSLPQPMIRKYFREGHPAIPDPTILQRLYPPGEKRIERLDKQVQQFQQRLDELEKRCEELLKRFPDEPEKPKTQNKEKSVQQKDKQVRQT